METRRIPPGHLLAGFVLVAGPYLAIHLTLVGSLAIASRVGWPATFEWLTAEPLSAERFRDEAAGKIPAGLFAVCAAAGAALSMISGWMIARTAVFAPTAHAVFLAVLLFVGFLQTVTAAPAAVRWMPLVLMGLLPVATLLGAKFSLAGREVSSEEEGRPD